MNIKPEITSKKIKFWIIGAIIAIFGVVLARVGIKYIATEYIAYMRVAGITFAMLGLYIFMLGIDRNKT